MYILKKKDVRKDGRKEEIMYMKQWDRDRDRDMDRYIEGEV